MGSPSGVSHWIKGSRAETELWMGTGFGTWFMIKEAEAFEIARQVETCKPDDLRPTLERLTEKSQSRSHKLSSDFHIYSVSHTYLPPQHTPSKLIKSKRKKMRSS